MSKKAGTSLVDQISAMDAKLQVDKVQSDEYRNQRYSVLAKFIAAQNKAEAKGKDGAAPRKPAGASPQLTKAQAALREGVSLGPGSAAAQRALQLFTACLDAEPTNSDAWFGRGAALAAVEGIELCADEAKLCYTQCCRLDPRHVSAQAELGSLLWSEGFEEEAEAATKAALKLDPKHPLALLTQVSMAFVEVKNM
jgi:tetratricopeptide (TPR) repeat protein